MNTELEFIKKTIDNYFDIDISLKTRKRDVFFAKCLFTYFAKEITFLPLCTIAKHINYKKHCSAVHCLKVYDWEIKNNNQFKKWYSDLVDIFLQNNPKIKNLRRTILITENELQNIIENLEGIKEKTDVIDNCISTLEGFLSKFK